MTATAQTRKVVHADIKLNIDMAPHDLEREIGKVLDNLQPVEREVRDLEGRWHALSILPYRTQDNKIDGVVLALQDIDAIKLARDQLARSNDFFRGMSDTVREPLLVLDADLRVVNANESFLNTFKVSSDQTSNRLLFDLGNGHGLGDEYFSLSLLTASPLVYFLDIDQTQASRLSFHATDLPVTPQVPEPASLMIVGASLVPVWLLRRNRRGGA